MSIKPRTNKPFSYGLLALGLALILGSTEAVGPVSYTHLSLPTIILRCRSRWSRER